MPPSPERPPTATTAPSARRLRDVADLLRQEATGGRLMLAATAAALLWANLGGTSYSDVWARNAGGPAALHLDGMTLRAWVSDGLLAVFFFVAGLELKRELAVGQLSTRRTALVPVFTALGGMVVPALVFLAVSRGSPGAGSGWPIPVATDIAFSLGVLALVGTGLPSGARTLLLSLAVVDDLGAILLIAIVFTDDLRPLWLLAGLACVAAYALLLRAGRTAVLPLAVLGVAAWLFVHASGIHATVAGVLLGLLTPATARQAGLPSPCERFGHRMHPLSAGLVVPLFALASTGLPVASFADAVRDPVAQGVVAGLVLGKPVGLLLGAWLPVRAGFGDLPGGVGWSDIVPVALLGGIGYTVSLLMADLGYGHTPGAEQAAVGVLAASVLAGLAATVLLRLRGRRATPVSRQ